MPWIDSLLLERRCNGFLTAQQEYRDSFTMFDYLTYTAIQNALIAGSLAAIIAAFVGYFLVIRGMTFTAHALPNIGFAGAAGAILLGLEPMVGLLAFSISAAIAVGLLGKQLRERDIAVGIIMAFTLGLGVLFISLYQGYAEQVYSILYGNILGVSQTHVLLTAVLSTLTISFLLILFRPLLFSSLDPTVAESRGIPVRSLTMTFLVLVAIAISMSVQVVGALLIFTLLIGPPATAIRIVQRPLWAITIAILLGICYTWLGIFFAANGLFGISGTDTWPASVYITSLSFAVYLPVRLLSPLWIGHKSRRDTDTSSEERDKSIPYTKGNSLPIGAINQVPTLRDAINCQGIANEIYTVKKL
jgi:zinc/manganese transport system permease protein